jgi:hypothetical protein
MILFNDYDYVKGMTTWSYTPTCRGFDYFYGYWNAAQDYYSHGGSKALDMHENFETDYTVSGEYSTSTPAGSFRLRCFRAFREEHRVGRPLFARFGAAWRISSA